MDKAAILRHLGPAVQDDYPLAPLTSLKVGGPADFFATARAEAELRELVCRAWEIDLPLLMLGNGSNVLLADRGFRGLVIHNRCAAVNSQLSPEAAGVAVDQALCVQAQAGAMLPRIAHEAIKQGFHDLVYATGIPGSVGGAVFSNAGAYGWCLADNLSAVRYLARDGQVCTAPAAELELRYRHSRFRETGEVVLGATLQLHQREALAQSAELNRRRRQSQPLQLPNAGSMFKNPDGAAAGWLIEQAGLKGQRSGQAQISARHANFIVNLGGATAADV
ncbi:MAG: UDP-N-acetylmuramate dehydrogenase, partial [Chloroflexota bacterium]